MCSCALYLALPGWEFSGPDMFSSVFYLVLPGSEFWGPDMFIAPIFILHCPVVICLAPIFFETSHVYFRFVSGHRVKAKFCYIETSDCKKNCASYCRNWLKISHLGPQAGLNLPALDLPKACCEQKNNKIGLTRARLKQARFKPVTAVTGLNPYDLGESGLKWPCFKGGSL